MSFRAIALGLGLCLSLAAHPAHAGDGVFTVPTLSQARSEAGEERLALVFLTDDGNADCEYMEAEAWTHPDVRTWVDSHAVAARIDSQSFHGASLKGQYGVEVLPALLAFRSGTLARQHEGPMDGNKLLAWLEVVRVGDVQAADLVLAADAETSTRSDGSVDVEARIVDALGAPNPQAAVATLLSAWRDTVGTPQQAERRPRLIEALSPYLINEDARALVARERDSAWARHKRRKTLPDLVDWMVLNHALDDDAATIKWVDGARIDKKGREWLRRVLYDPQDPLLQVLMKGQKWRVLGQSIGDPIALVDLRQRVHEQTKITITGAESAADRAALREEFSAIVVALLAEGREREARNTSDHIRASDKDYGPTLVNMAIEARQPRRWMRGLLNPNRAEQVQLAMKLTQELQMR